MTNVPYASGIAARAVIAASCVAIAATSLPQAAAAQASYQGIYVLSPKLRGERSLLPQSIYSTSYVNGIVVTAVWNQIEPSPGTYDWRWVDQEVNAAVASGKGLAITVIAGEYTPTWLYGSPYNVPGGKFYWGAHNGQNHQCAAVTVPVPWNANYLQAYSDMMQAFSQHLQSIQGAYGLVTRVNLTGANTDTAELHLAYCRNSDGAQVWQQLGYTPNLMYGAGQSLMQAANNAFPDKLLDLNILENGGLPTINNNGQIVTRRDPTYVNVAWNLITWALSSNSGFSNRFAVEWNGFNSYSSQDPAKMVIDAGKDGAVMGWETNDYGGIPVGTECNGKSGDAQACNSSGYQGILDGTIGVGGQFIEVFPVNVPQFPDAFEQAEGYFDSDRQQQQ